MTDLSQLFLVSGTLPQSHLHARTYVHQDKQAPTNLFSTKSVSYAQPHSKQPQTLNIDSLNSIKTQKQLSKILLTSNDLRDELYYFKTRHFKQFVQKSIIVLAPLLILQLFGLLNGKLCFEAMLFSISLLALEAQVIENPTLKIFFNTLPVLTYLALFYDILTLNNLAPDYNVTLTNVPAFLLALVATFNFYLFRNLGFLTDFTQAVIIQPKMKEVSQHLVQKFKARVKNSLKFAMYSLSFNVVLLLGFVIYCIFNVKPVLFWSTLITIPFGLFAYASIDCLAFAVEFFSRQIHLLKMKVQFSSIDACIALLRTKPTSNPDEFRKIHERCLVELGRNLRVCQSYLETPVRVNYAINSYRDIFEFFAIENLNRMLISFTEINAKIAKNNKVIESTKTIKQDLFILVKKAIAIVSNNYQTYRLLKEIHKRQLIFMILSVIASKRPMKGQFWDLSHSLIERLNKGLDGKYLLEMEREKIKEEMGRFNWLKDQLKEGDSRISMHVERGSDERGNWMRSGGEMMEN